MHADNTHQPLRLGPGNWPLPTGDPIFWILAAALTAVVMAQIGWELLYPVVLADPRPEVQRFVAAALKGDMTKGERDALSAYRATLEPHRQQALSHEINYLLGRHGCPTRIAFDADGQVAEMAGTPAPRGGIQPRSDGPTSRRCMPPTDALAHRFDPDYSQKGTP